jgi:hypothetical protein
MEHYNECAECAYVNRVIQRAEELKIKAADKRSDCPRLSNLSTLSDLAKAFVDRFMLAYSKGSPVGIEDTAKLLYDVLYGVTRSPISNDWQPNLHDTVNSKFRQDIDFANGNPFADTLGRAQTKIQEKINSFIEFHLGVRIYTKKQTTGVKPVQPVQHSTKTFYMVYSSEENPNWLAHRYQKSSQTAQIQLFLGKAIITAMYPESNSEICHGEHLSREDIFSLVESTIMAVTDSSYYINKRPESMNDPSYYNRSDPMKDILHAAHLWAGIDTAGHPQLSSTTRFRSTTCSHTEMARTNGDEFVNLFEAGGNENRFQTLRGGSAPPFESYSCPPPQQSQPMMTAGGNGNRFQTLRGGSAPPVPTYTAPAAPAMAAPAMAAPAWQMPTSSAGGASAERGGLSLATGPSSSAAAAAGASAENGESVSCPPPAATLQQITQQMTGDSSRLSLATGPPMMTAGGNGNRFQTLRGGSAPPVPTYTAPAAPAMAAPAMAAPAMAAPAWQMPTSSAGGASAERGGLSLATGPSSSAAAAAGASAENGESVSCPPPAATLQQITQQMTGDSSRLSLATGPSSSAAAAAGASAENGESVSCPPPAATLQQITQQMTGDSSRLSLATGPSSSAAAAAAAAAGVSAENGDSVRPPPAATLQQITQQTGTTKFSALNTDAAENVIARKATSKKRKGKDNGKEAKRKKEKANLKEKKQTTSSNEEEEEEEEEVVGDSWHLERILSVEEIKKTPCEHHDRCGLQACLAWKGGPGKEETWDCCMNCLEG